MKKAKPKVVPGALVLDKRVMKWQNVGLVLAELLVWVAARFLYVQVYRSSTPGDFMKWDVLFILLPPIGAFFFNWYKLRELGSSVVTRWAVGWAGIELVVFAVVIFVGAAQLHRWMGMI